MDAERRFEPWPFILAGLLVAMMTGSVSFYVIAAHHPDPVIVDDAFAASERYNQALEAARASDALGLELGLGVTETAAGVRLRVEPRGAGGRPVGAVSVRRVRPAEGGLDALFPLRAAQGAFEGEVPLPRPGRWRLEVSADVDGRAVREVLELRRSS